MTDNIAASDTAQKIAHRCAQKMFKADQATHGLGINIDEISPGSATLSMIITDKMLNGHQTCHGGYIFTLADSAFAFACNSYNKTTVAAGADISFLHPVMLGEKLTACAIEKHRAGRSGVYDVAVTNSQNKVVALFRGKSRTISDKGILDV